jgi:hypothetical protein
MYNAIIHKTEEINIAFSDDDYEVWKKMNPDAAHSHEHFAMELAKQNLDSDEWAAKELTLICILFSRD